MQVREVMSQRPQYLGADATIREVAEKMRSSNIGFEPLVEDDKIKGIVTDRDITVRAVAEGKGPDEKAMTVGTDKVLYTFEDTDIKEALKNMHEQKVQRLVVLSNPDKKDLVGVVTVSDIAEKCEDSEIASEIVNCVRHYH